MVHYYNLLMIISLQEHINDPILRVFSRMTDSELRDPKQLIGLSRATGIQFSNEGIFIAESSNVIQRALNAGLKPFALISEKRWLEPHRDLFDRIEHLELSLKSPIPQYLGSHAEIENLTGFKRTVGPIAAFHRPTLPLLSDILKEARRIAILEDITNFTNIGAIFRSAAALGIDAVLVTPGCHDPFYRRAARVSMGCVFQVPWTRIPQIQETKRLDSSLDFTPDFKPDSRLDSNFRPDSNSKPTFDSDTWAQVGIPQLHAFGFRVAALALCGNSLSLKDPRIAQAEKLALVLGTEGDGLAQNTIATCDYTVRIPMAHGVDSLNVAAASAVAFWETCGQYQ